MNISTILLLAVTISAVYSILFLYFMWKEQKKINKQLNITNEVTLGIQRERMENKIIEATDMLLSTPLRFSDVNHLFLSNVSNELKMCDVVYAPTFFEEMGINLDEITIEPRFVTCLMPFNKQYKSKYHTILKSCEKAGYVCHRSDEKFVQGDIVKYTMELILRSQLIIALLDGRNANVFYEIGIAHAIGKSVLLLSDVSRLKEVPFNIKGNRLLLYNTQDDLYKKLTDVLISIENESGTKK